MNNIYLKKLFTFHGISIVFLCILLHSSNTYIRSYIMEYFMFDKLVQTIDIGSFNIKLASIISVVIAILVNGICDKISSGNIMNIDQHVF